ncbi:MAG: sigma-70 family RNA polymerase sigma factor [Chloroflexota bacterium]
MHIDEQMLVERAKNDPAEFIHLYNRYVDVIFAYAQREIHDTQTAQDIVSITFTIALRKISTFRWRGTSFGAWLYKIARNEIRKQYNRNKRLKPFTDLPAEPKLDTQLNQHQLVAQIRQIMVTLSERDQEILRLCYDEALSHEEIAVILSCSTRNVAVRLHRALTRLRAKVSHLQEEDLPYATSK